MSYNTTFVSTFIVLAFGGIINAGYLVYQHYKKKPLVCPLNHDCSIVTESKYSKIFFIRNEILGLIFYLFLFICMILLLINSNLSFLKNIILILTSLGLLFSIALVLIQKYLIKDYCFYCMISAIINLLIFLNSIYLLWS